MGAISLEVEWKQLCCRVASDDRGDELYAFPNKQEQPDMTNQAKNDEKVQKPSTHYDEPHEVVSDSSLSLDQKIKTLDALEQDARQLADASSEGMDGGERGKLHEVLVAGKALDRPSATDADSPADRRTKQSGVK